MEMGQGSTNNNCLIGEQEEEEVEEEEVEGEKGRYEWGVAV